MKIFTRATATLALFSALTLPAAAAGNYVFDGAGILSSATVSTLNATIDTLHEQTGKEVIVDTVTTTNGDTPRAFAEREFASHAVNGVMIFVSKQPKSIGVIPDPAAKVIFPVGMTSTIRSAIRSSFKSGDYDGGITNGVNLVVDTYRSHEGALRQRRTNRSYAPVVPATNQGFAEERSGGGINWFWIIVIGIAAFLIIRAIIRAASGPRYYPPSGGGYGAGPGYGGGPGYGPGGPGYGGPGYGGGGFGGGGGGFFSSMLGGLGGAFLGNELFNSFNRPQGGGFEQPPQTYDSSAAGFGGADNSGSGYDTGAFQNDPGQADMGNSSFGDWGDSSGGGFGDSSGGGDNSGGGW